MEVTEQKQNHSYSSPTYSWGPLYEAMKEMDTDYKDEVIQKGFDLFKKLDAVYSWVEIRSIIEKMPLTVYEQNKLNSPCLDGILLTYLCNSPLNKIIIDYPKYVDTFRFYLSKGYDAVNINTLCLIATTNRTELYACLDENNFPTFSVYRFAPQPEGWINAPSKKLLFEHACTAGNLEMAKLTYENNITTSNNFYNCKELADYPNIVEFLLEKDIELEEEIIEDAITNAYERSQRDIVYKFLLNKKLQYPWTLLWRMVGLNDLEMVKILLEHRPKQRQSYPISTYSAEMAQLLTKYGVANSSHT